MKDKSSYKKIRSVGLCGNNKTVLQYGHRVNARDYTEEQLNVWATGKEDCAKRDMSFKEHYSYVAVYKGDVVGSVRYIGKAARTEEK